jgi:hypothetical protein
MQSRAPGRLEILWLRGSAWGASTESALNRMARRWAVPPAPQDQVASRIWGLTEEPSFTIEGVA